MTAAGNLTEKVTLLQQVTVPDGAGGSTTTWQPLLAARAAMKVLKSGEAVMAGRIQGTQTIVFTLRMQAALDSADLTMRLRNERTTKEYNILGITPDPLRQWCDVLVQTDEL